MIHVKVMYTKSNIPNLETITIHFTNNKIGIMHGFILTKFEAQELFERLQIALKDVNE
jgi:hypothetical protein